MGWDGIGWDGIGCEGSKQRQVKKCRRTDGRKSWREERGSVSSLLAWWRRSGEGAGRSGRRDRIGPKVFAVTRRKQIRVTEEATQNQPRLRIKGGAKQNQSNIRVTEDGFVYGYGYGHGYGYGYGYGHACVSKSKPVKAPRLRRTRKKRLSVGSRPGRI